MEKFSSNRPDSVDPPVEEGPKFRVLAGSAHPRVAASDPGRLAAEWHFNRMNRPVNKNLRVKKKIDK
jgi:hypothetical protein